MLFFSVPARAAVWQPIVAATLIAIFLSPAAWGQNADGPSDVAAQKEGVAQKSAKLEETIALHTNQQNFAAAGQSWRELASLRATTLGDNHWQTIEARMSASLCDQLASMSPENRTRVFDAAVLHAEASKLREQGQHDAAMEKAKAALETQTELLGQASHVTATTYMTLGTAHLDLGQFAEAEKCLTQCVDSFTQAAGESYEATLMAMGTLARVHQNRGDFPSAEKWALKEIEIRRQVYGKNHESLIMPLNRAGLIYNQFGVHERALAAQVEAIHIARETIGEKNLQTATIYLCLADVYQNLRDFGKAQIYLKIAWEIRRNQLGEKHPATAIITGQLAGAYSSLGETEYAEKLFEDARQILEQSLGDQHAETLKVYHNFAHLAASKGRHEQAAELFRKVLTEMEKNLGEDHMIVAGIRINLAHALYELGRYDEALRLAYQTQAYYDRTLSNAHPSLIESLGLIGRCRWALGQTSEAEPPLRNRLLLSHHFFSANALIQSERQQLQYLLSNRHVLDEYLSLPQTATADARAGYSYLLDWKGAIASHQQRLRQLQTAATDSTATSWQKIAASLASTSLHPPESADYPGWMEQLLRLGQEKESLEQNLIRIAANDEKLRAKQVVATEAVQQSLPAGTALIDLFLYQHTAYVGENGITKPTHEERLLAFVVRRDRPIVRVDLGNASPIAEAIERWCRMRGFPPREGSADPAAVVAKLVWEPLREHVEGCDTLLISPDGATAKMPWHILPGRETGSYLIEDFAIAMAPVPQLLPSLLNDNSKSQPQDTTAPSLLLMGGIDFDAPPPGVAAGEAQNNDLLSYKPLPGSADEVRAIKEQFTQSFPAGDVLLLDGEYATETTFRFESPRRQWLHIATHGFFSPPKIKAALALPGQIGGHKQASDKSTKIDHVGYLSGLALAGANTRTAGEDDGLLTAAELSTLDLRNVEVAVLSGCETGLGTIAGGEGALGLQRSLQIAGVRTTVTSLWKVPDKQTSQLMQRFYQNVWDRKLPKLAALREAQLWLMHGGDEPTASRRPPHYWAAFVLSGDWR